MARGGKSAISLGHLFAQPLAFLAFLVAMVASGPAALAATDRPAPFSAAFDQAPSVFNVALPAGFQLMEAANADPIDPDLHQPALVPPPISLHGAEGRVEIPLPSAPRPTDLSTRPYRARAPPLR